MRLCSMVLLINFMHEFLYINFVELDVYMTATCLKICRGSNNITDSVIAVVFLG